MVGGGFFSDFSPDYGPNRLFGIGGFVDLNLRGHLGVEGEMRFLRFNQTYDVHEDNYKIGPRYRWRFGRWEPYGKFMIGNGQFNFPFSYGHGGYLLLVPGGGLDIHFHRFTVRAIDYEYQHWFNFQNSSLSPMDSAAGSPTGFSSRVREIRDRRLIRISSQTVVASVDAPACLSIEERPHSVVPLIMQRSRI